ncbi:MAG: class I SAM-dependent methyltransferase [Bosea sp. (in: a-proteobacteria)]
MTKETMPETNRSPVAENVRLTSQNFEAATRSLTHAERYAMQFAMKLSFGELTITLPRGPSFVVGGTGDGPKADLIVHDLSFARRLLSGGDIGFAEAYLRGEWETSDLPKFLELFAANYHVVSSMLSHRPLAKLWQRFRHFLNRNTKSGSRRNIHAHYDLGNAFYSSWLDGTMTYSSAIFAPGDNDLSSAQQRKYRELATRIGLTREDHVLEIGCGWGGFAEFAAREIGCRVTGLTISQEQFAFAQERIAKAGLSDRVTFKLQDYRDETGTYDKVASIEMFEAVGEAFWPVYFRKLDEVLKPGGTAGLQVITIKEESWTSYTSEIDFIRAYIFPGGMLPTPTIMANLGQNFGLPLTSEKIFGLDYANTLAAWRERFRAAWPQLMPLGFDERFRRMWEYYLAYCEAGFRTGNIDVRQMVFAKKG